MDYGSLPPLKNPIEYVCLVTHYSYPHNHPMVWYGWSDIASYVHAYM